MESLYRIPFVEPYGFAEYRWDATELPDYDYMADDAKKAENAHRTILGLPLLGDSPLTDNAMREGAAPTYENLPPQFAPIGRGPEQAPPPLPTPSFITYQCDQCGGPADLGKVMKTAKMRRPAAPVKCRTCKDGQYAHTVQWIDA